jgi:hypothetical protein
LTRTFRLRLLIPATALLAIIVAGAFFLRTPKEPQLHADLGSDSIYRAQEIDVIGPSGTLLHPPASLNWKAYPGTAEYKVGITEVDGTGLLDANTKAQSLEIPRSVSARMLPGKPLLWQVTALDQAGKVLATSQVQRFSVSPAPPHGTNQ